MNVYGLEQSSSSSRTFVSSLLSSEHPKPSYSFSLHSSPPFLRSAETVSAIVLITKLSTRMSCRVPLSLIFIFANPTHSFICEFSKELLNIYSVPGNILAAHDTKSYRTLLTITEHYRVQSEFDGHTEEEAQNEIQEGTESKGECSEAVILILKNNRSS